MSGRRLRWLVVGVLAALVTVLVAVLLVVWLGRDSGDADDPADPGTASGAAGDAGHAAESAVATSEETATEPSGSPTPDESGPPLESLPLRDPGDHLPADGVSDIPAIGSDLVEGDYFAHVRPTGPTSPLLEADVQVFYFGGAADEYLAVHDPTAEIPPPNGFVIVNESTSVRQVPTAADVRIWDWCFGGDGQLEFAERSLDEWRTAPADGSQECAAGADLGHGGELYWLQVRGGETQRLIGQFLP